MIGVTEPIGLSTSWNGPGSSPDRLLEQHRSLGFRRVARIFIEHYRGQSPYGQFITDREVFTSIGFGFDY